MKKIIVLVVIMVMIISCTKRTMVAENENWYLEEETNLFGKVNKYPSSFVTGSLDSNFFIHFEEVKVHRLFSCTKGNSVLDFYFLERGEKFSLCKYVVRKKGKIQTVKVFKYSYKDLEGFCSAFRFEVPTDIQSFVSGVLKHSSRKSEDLPKSPTKKLVSEVLKNVDKKEGESE